MRISINNNTNKKNIVLGRDITKGMVITHSLWEDPGSLFMVIGDDFGLHEDIVGMDEFGGIFCLSDFFTSADTWGPGTEFILIGKVDSLDVKWSKI